MAFAAGWTTRPSPPEPRPVVVFERVTDPTTAKNYHQLLDLMVRQALPRPKAP